MNKTNRVIRGLRYFDRTHEIQEVKDILLEISDMLDHKIVTINGVFDYIKYMKNEHVVEVYEIYCEIYQQADINTFRPQRYPK